MKLSAIGSYVLRVCCCALIAGVLQSVNGKNSASQLQKMISGLFLAFVIISPLRQFQLGDLWELPENIYLDGQEIVSSAKLESKEAISNIIIEQTRAYILDEAASLDADIQVTEVCLDPSSLAPIRVELRGTLSPYDRTVLSDCIETALGISREEQLWKN